MTVPYGSINGGWFNPQQVSPPTPSAYGLYQAPEPVVLPQYEPIKAPDFSYSPSAQIVDQLKKARDQFQGQKPQGLFTAQPQNTNRVAPIGGLWRAEAPNASSLAAQYLKG